MMQVAVPAGAQPGQQMQIQVESHCYGMLFQELIKYPAFQAANPKSTTRGVNANPQING